MSQIYVAKIATDTKSAKYIKNVINMIINTWQMGYNPTKKRILKLKNWMGFSKLLIKW